MKTTTTRLFLFAVLFFTAPVVLHAQEDPPPDTLDTPIDGWLVVLIMAAVLYGVWKYVKFKKPAVK